MQRPQKSDKIANHWHFTQRDQIDTDRRDATTFERVHDRSRVRTARYQNCHGMCRIECT